MAAVYTKNFDAMRSFYADTLRLRRMEPPSDGAVWFRDFHAEIQLEKVDSDDAVGVHGALILYSEEVERVSAGLQERGVDVHLRPTSGGPEALLRDPDRQYPHDRLLAESGLTNRRS